MIVVTKGAGRVSEVSARFTLDVLPGKQMAIDADLNAGLLTPHEAGARQADVATEADFYGAMAAVIGVSTPRVHQIKADTLAKLRGLLGSGIGSATRRSPSPRRTSAVPRLTVAR